MLTLLCIRRVGSDLAPAQLEIQPEILNDLLREKTDQVRVAGEQGIVIRKDLLRGRGSPDVVVLFQQQHAQPRARQIGGCHKTIMTRTQDDDVVFGFHRACEVVSTLGKV